MSLCLGAYLAVGVVVLLSPAVGLAQDAAGGMGEAVCDVPGINWTFNSVGESPCQVATDLAAVCNFGFYLIPSLPPNAHYVGPPMQNPCQCNTVFYSLLSACAACQGSGWLNWPRFSENCTEVYASTFPRPIPVGVKVPMWAYADFTSTSNNFTLVVPPGFYHGPAPASSAIPTASTAVSSSSISASSSSASASASSTESESDSRAGVIAGSVVGGIVGLAIIVCLSLYCILRHRGRHPHEDHQSSVFTRVPVNEPVFQEHKHYDPLPDSKAFVLPAPGPYGGIYGPSEKYSPPGTSPTMGTESSSSHGHR